MEPAGKGVVLGITMAVAVGVAEVDETEEGDVGFPQAETNKTTPMPKIERKAATL